MARKATARKNGKLGYKAVVAYDCGRTYQPISKNFPTAEDAKAYAQKWIDANDAPKPTAEQAEAVRNEKADAFLKAWNKAWE